MPVFGTRIALTAALVMLVTPAFARECPLARTTFEPVDEPRTFQMRVEQVGVGYRFILLSRSLGRTMPFIGSPEGGTGYLNILEETEDADQEGILSRVVLFRADLKTTDAWNKGERRVAYAYFEKFAYELWQRARANAEDDKPGSSPPDGLWRVAQCRPR